MHTKNNIKNLEVEVDYLSNFDVIFWDFDGVIKESFILITKPPQLSIFMKIIASLLRMIYLMIHF